MKQSLKSYRMLLDRIAVILIANSALFILLTAALNMLEEAVEKAAGESVFTVISFGVLNCTAYFASFTLPILLYRRMPQDPDLYEKNVKPAPRKKASFADIFFAIGLGLGANVIFVKINGLILELIGYGGYLENSFAGADIGSGLQAAVYFVYMAVIPAVSEELLFRKLICGELYGYGTGVSIISSGILFGLMHANAGQLLYATLSGMILAWLYIKSGSVIYPIILHFINNAVSALSVIIAGRSYEKAVRFSALMSGIFILWLAAALIYFALRCVSVRKGAVTNAEHYIAADRLTAADKVKGFFSVGMVIYIVGSLLRMIYYLII